MMIVNGIRMLNTALLKKSSIMINIDELRERQELK